MNIRIYHEFVDRIDSSVLRPVRSLLGIMWLRRVMPRSGLEGQICDIVYPIYKRMLDFFLAYVWVPALE